jgi:hypothetical protein
MSWSIDKEKSIERFLKTYRIERIRKFSQLDIQFMRVLETNDTSTKVTIIEHKSLLRNFPSTITNESFSTIDELRALWPSGSLDLPDVW